MILVKKQALERVLKALGKNYQWLARQFSPPVHKSYISQVISNKTKVTDNVISVFVGKIHMDVHTIFHIDGAPDRREFLGDTVYINQEPYRNGQYKEWLSRILGDGNGKHI